MVKLLTEMHLDNRKNTYDWKLVCSFSVPAKLATWKVIGNTVMSPDLVSFPHRFKEVSDSSWGEGRTFAPDHRSNRFFVSLSTASQNPAGSLPENVLLLLKFPVIMLQVVFLLFPSGHLQRRKKSMYHLISIKKTLRNTVGHFTDNKTEA